MATSKNSSAARSFNNKTSTTKAPAQSLNNAIPYVDRRSLSDTGFCWKQPFAFHIVGAAMQPIFSDGDTVIIDPAVQPKDGDFVIVGLPDRPLAFCKYVASEGATYRLVATNPSCEPLDPTLPVLGVMTKHHTRADDRKEIEQAILLQASSARCCSDDEDFEPTTQYETPWQIGASQINTDLTVAAQCEFEDDISIDHGESGFFDLLRSAAYWSLREQFVKDAASGDQYAFMKAIWRGDIAGRCSPDRFVPSTPAERRERFRRKVAQDLESRAIGEFRQAKREDDSDD